MNAMLPLAVVPTLTAPPHPLLTRGGWATFTVVAYVLFILVPALNLWLPAGHVFHLSDYFVTLAGKIMCYAIVALAMDLIWGYTGILSLGHGLFFALGGYMMGMYLMRSIGARRRLPQRPARLHGLPRLEGLPLVLELHRSFLVRAAAGRAGARAARVRVRVLRLPVADQGRVFLDHHAGADLRVHAAVLPQRHGLRRQQRLHRFQAHPRLSDRHAGDADGAVRGHRRRAARRIPARALYRDLAPGPGADGDPRRREPRDVLRLQPAALQALHLDALGGAVRDRRRALRAAGRHHQSRRNVAGQFDRDRDLGRRRRTRHARRSHPRRVHRQRRQELVHGGVSGVLAVLPRLAVHPGHAVPAAGRDRRSCAAADGAGHERPCPAERVLEAR